LGPRFQVRVPWMGRRDYRGPRILGGERPRDQVMDQGSDKGSRIRTQVRDPGHRFQDQ